MTMGTLRYGRGGAIDVKKEKGNRSMLWNTKRCPACLLLLGPDHYYIITRRSGKNYGRQDLSSHCKSCAPILNEEWRKSDTPGANNFIENKNAASKARYRERHSIELARMNAYYHALSPEQKARRNELRKAWRKRTGKK